MAFIINANPSRPFTHPLIPAHPLIAAATIQMLSSVLRTLSWRCWTKIFAGVIKTIGIYMVHPNPSRNAHSPADFLMESNGFLNRFCLTPQCIITQPSSSGVLPNGTPAELHKKFKVFWRDSGRLPLRQWDKTSTCFHSSLLAGPALFDDRAGLAF